ncbi:MAG: NnrS family protein, partial [Sphingomonadales bacterium]|nr:NnrS family protein [Sphingomonadales bacterium]
LLYGFVAAAVAGFIMTAVPNWTGRMPICGRPLMALAALWLFGRIAMFMPEFFGAVPSAVVDAAFLPTLAVLIGREIIAGNNKRNFPVVLVISLFAAGNLFFHFEQQGVLGLDGLGIRLGVGAMTVLLSIIGGRVVPSFTENWLVSQKRGGRVVGFNGYDKVVLLVTAAVMLTWVLMPDFQWLWTGFTVLSALHLSRMVRWHGWVCGGEILVLILHVAYLWLPVGFGLMAAELYYDWGNNIGLHALTAGAMANMIMAVMTRATLGHSGRALKADAITKLIYLMVVLGAATRTASFFAGDYVLYLEMAGGLWSGGFMLFAIHYGRMHFTARRKP